MPTGRASVISNRTLMLCCTLALGAACAVHGEQTNQPHHVQFERDIRAFERSDETNPPPRNAILFIGSSSIRLWTNAPARFPGHVIINRGFGGSHLSDSVAFAERIVIPYKPKVVVLYAGDNDVAAGKTPEVVFNDFKTLAENIHAALPQTQIAYISIKPSPSRMKHFEQARTANRLIQEYMSARPRLTFVDIFTPMLDSNGQPKAELFVSDRLHLNEDGYKLWAGIVGPVLDKLDPPLTD